MTTTNRFFFFVIVLFVLASLLSGCNMEDVQKATNAGDGSNAATAIAVNASPRMDACTMGSRQIVLNAITADVNANNEQPLSITVDAWLDSKLSTFTCIAVKAE